MARKLFWSFSGLMQTEFSNCAPTRDELMSGLFLFGCSRDHALTPRPSAYPEFGKLVREAILKAETEGRCQWRVAYGVRLMGEVYDILTAAGYVLPKKQVITPRDTPCDAFSVNYFIKRLKLDVELVT